MMQEDQVTMAKTQMRLRCRAYTAWVYENRPVHIGASGVIRTAGTPHMRRVVQFLLVQRWRRDQDMLCN